MENKDSDEYSDEIFEDAISVYNAFNKNLEKKIVKTVKNVLLILMLVGCYMSALRMPKKYIVSLKYI